jgi:hypothetical protein
MENIGVISAIYMDRLFLEYKNRGHVYG